MSASGDSAGELAVDAVQEPPVVAGDHGAAGESQQRVLQRGQCLDVEVVGGLVQQQQVAALPEGERKIDGPRSPPDMSPAGFCWSLPLNPNAAT
jgi:hypothetical protein